MDLLSNLYNFLAPFPPPRELGQALLWWLTIQFYSAAALPLVFFLFRPAPDRGWALSKSAGVLGVAYVSWLAASAHLIPFSRASLLVGVALFAVIGAALWRQTWRRLLRFVRLRWRLILAVELSFLYIFLFFTNIRTYCPEAMFDPGRSGAEKFGNMTHLASVYSARYFPPEDCWFANYPINYYYFGVLQVASIGRMAGLGPEIAFNLGLATFVALTFLGAFGLTFWFTGRVGWALAAGWAVTVFGNLDGVQQFFLNFAGEWRAAAGPGRLHGLGALWQALTVATFKPDFDFWRSSRIVEHTITEFPWFTAILGDLHPHHASLSSWALTIGVLLCLLRSPGWLRGRWQLSATAPRLIVLAALYGLAGPVNAWDKVTLLGAIVAVLVARAALNVRPAWRSIGWWIGLNVVVLIPLIYKIGSLFVLPFDSAFAPALEPGVSLFQPLPRYLRTWMSDYITHFGFFLAPILTEMGLLIRDALREGRRAVDLNLTPLAESSSVSVSGFTAAGADAAAGVSNDDTTTGRSSFETPAVAPRGPQSLFLIGGLGFGAVFLLKALSGYYLPGFCIALILAALWLALRRSPGGRDVRLAAAMTLLVFSQCVVLFVEFFFVNDRYVGTLERYNTLFKFWYPLWPIYGVVAGWAVWRLWGRLPRGAGRSGWGWRAVYVLAAAFVVWGGMTYPLASTANRTGVFNAARARLARQMEAGGAQAALTNPRYVQLKQSMQRTLDARAYMAAEPDGLASDFAIVRWLLEHENGDALILEGNKHGSCYGPWGRTATLSGNKVLVGWGHHEHQWRPDNQYQIINDRMTKIMRIYQTADWDEARRLLVDFGVDYVLVGSLERKEYKPDQLKKFAEHCDVVVVAGDSVLYRAPRE
ncbi:MAG: hypothetical protein Kow0059_05050 [Candidatus Sumerlaeia bacterium]